GSHITFVGMNPAIELRKHQINAVAHIIYGGNTLLAHEVGAGKTFEMVAAAMEMKRLGLCHKSMIVVPNHIIEQFAAEWLQLYPSANILVSTKKDFEPKNRRKFTARISTGDYDAVIIGHSQFEKIPMSLEYQCRMLEEQLEDLLSGIAEAKKNKGDNFTVKQLEKSRKSLQLRLDKLNDQSRKDDLVTFEELGVDRLFVDESHGYKNLYLYTKMRNVGGIAQTEAQKSADMFMKCRYPGTLSISGAPVISGGTGSPADILLEDDRIITIAGELTNTTPYRVSKEDATAGTVIATATTVGHADASRFTYTSTDYDLIANSTNTPPNAGALYLAAHTGGTATCMEKAVCTVCNQPYGDLGSHAYGSLIAEIPATHDTIGTKAHYKCSVCHEYFDDAKHETTTEDLTIPIIPHSYGLDWENDSDNHWKECGCGSKIDQAAHTYGDWTETTPASETTKGEKERVCSVCGYKETAEIPMIDNSGSPQTGDNSNMMLWIALLFVSGAGVLTTVVIGKKKKRFE
ncbi:MAG: SNF2-related protein, partial [Eubacteriales bacterium]|nr:SNF2-related protein [Eubacteriales bacterium]